MINHWDPSTFFASATSLQTRKFKMRTSYISYRTASLALVVGLAACSTTQPLPYSGIASSSKMQLNQRDATGRVPYEYKTETNWGKYSAFIVDPVVVYRGSDSQFEKISEEDKSSL